MTRASVMLVLGLLAALSLIPWHESPIYVSIATGIIVASLMSLADFGIHYRRYLKVGMQSLSHWNEYVRISASYLYRIEVDREYLLLRGKRFNQFQPVGGVYKSTVRGANALRRFGAIDDTLIAVDDKLQHDLRIRIKGRYVVQFLKWFESGRGREVDPWREFRGELVASGHVPGEVFPYIYYEVLQRRVNPLRFSDHAQCTELLIADIIDLIPNVAQTEALRTLKKQDHPDVRWVSSDKIKRQNTQPGHPSGEPIAITAGWTLDAPGE